MGKNHQFKDMNISYNDLLKLNSTIRRDICEIINESDECEELLGSLQKEYKDIFKSERTLLEDVERLRRENMTLKTQIEFIEKHGQSMLMNNVSACISIIMGIVLILTLLYSWLKII